MLCILDLFTSYVSCSRESEALGKRRSAEASPKKKNKKQSVGRYLNKGESEGRTFGPGSFHCSSDVWNLAISRQRGILKSNCCSSSNECFIVTPFSPFQRRCRPQIVFQGSIRSPSGAAIKCQNAFLFFIFFFFESAFECISVANNYHV